MLIATTRITIGIVVLFLSLVSLTSVFADHSPHHGYQDNYAYEAIIRALALGVSKNENSMSEELLTMYHYTSSLGIIILDRSRSKESLRGLSRLNYFQLDGALAEDHTCAVLRKGPVILPYLKETLRESRLNVCEQTLKKMRIKPIPGLCKKQLYIEKRVNGFISGIRRKVRCNE